MPLITIGSGMKQAFLGVKAYLLEFAVDANVVFGLREPRRQDNQGPGGANRVCFVPCDPKSGAAGTFRQPSMVGEREAYDQSDPPKLKATVRSIVDWERSLFIYVWAFDADHPRDELAQFTKHEALVEWVMRALVAVAPIDIEATTVSYLRPELETPQGVECVISARFTHPLYGVPTEVGYPGFTIRKPDSP